MHQQTSMLLMGPRLAALKSDSRLWSAGAGDSRRFRADTRRDARRAVTSANRLARLSPRQSWTPCPLHCRAKVRGDRFGRRPLTRWHARDHRGQKAPSRCGGPTPSRGICGGVGCLRTECQARDRRGPKGPSSVRRSTPSGGTLGCQCPRGQTVWTGSAGQTVGVVTPRIDSAATPRRIHLMRPSRDGSAPRFRFAAPPRPAGE